MPGVYVDADGALHIDVAELLAGAGYRDTPENRRELLAAVYTVFGAATVHETDDPIDGQ